MKSAYKGATILAIGAIALTAVLSNPTTTNAATSANPTRNGLGRQTMIEAKASLLHLTAEELSTKLAEGKTLYTIAAEQGVTLTELQSANYAYAEQNLKNRLTAGTLTQEQVDARLAQIKTRQASCDGSGQNQQNKLGGSLAKGTSGQGLGKGRNK